jgi:ribosomal protein S18 acetylase RimI-like enzyme
MPEGSKGMFVGSICIDPEFQGSGVGCALLTTATQCADAGQLTIWVHSSEAGASLFTINGLEDVGRLEIDLGQYSMDEDLRVLKPYIYRYMLRQPWKPD